MNIELIMHDVRRVQIAQRPSSQSRTEMVLYDADGGEIGTIQLYGPMGSLPNVTSDFHIAITRQGG